MNNSSRKKAISPMIWKEVSNSADKLADYIADILGCPITIEDSNHHLISYSKHTERIDEARISTIISRKVPDKVINGLWKNGIMAKLFESDDPVIIPAIDTIGLGNRVAVSIRKNNEILGFIWAHTDKKTLIDEELKLLKEAAIQVKQYILQNRSKRNKTYAGYKDFFWQLLTGNLKDKKRITELANQFDMDLCGRLSIVIIEFDDEVTETIEKHANYLAETLHYVQVIGRLFDQNRLILLVKQKDTDSRTVLSMYIQSFIEEISKRLEIDEKHVTGACGITYDSFLQITHSYRQAEKVLDLKGKYSKELDQVYTYQDIGVYQFIEELQAWKSDIHYKNETIEKLKAYDAEHRTDLLTTLKVFLESDSNVYHAAKKIHVHPNTMNYRLKRIADVGEIDLKNANQKIIAYLDLLIEGMKSKNK